MSATVCRVEQTATVAVLGPVGAGVRTVVEAASDIDRLPSGGSTSRPRLPFQLGRIDVGDEIVVRVLALSPDPRYRPLWPTLGAGAVGSVVVVDGRDIGAGFECLDQVERAGLPYGVLINRFEGDLVYPIADVRTAMDLEDRVVLADADGRDRVEAQMALLAVLDGLFGWT